MARHKALLTLEWVSDICYTVDLFDQYLLQFQQAEAISSIMTSIEMAKVKCEKTFEGANSIGTVL